MPVIATRKRPAKAPKRCFFPRLRLGAAVQPGGPGHPGHALPRWRANRAAAGYLCCGYPQNATGNADKGQAITTENRVLFHRVANTLNYLDIKTVIVSCGTCMDQLQNTPLARSSPAAGFWTSTNT